MEDVDAISDGIVETVDADAFSPPEAWIERLFRWTAQAIVVLLMAIVAIELVARGLFGWSLQSTNELGGYALVAITFLSMSTCLVNHAYHRVHFLEARMTARGRAWLRLLFDSLAFAVTAILVWQFARFELITWRSGDVAPTNLMTPFWMPRLVMLIGVAGLAISLLRTILGDVRRLRNTATD
jgi:TRAP-type C4-dicarboxylate transport system permease small subunit